MNHTPADYVNAGYKYESARSPDAARAVAHKIRAMLTSETPEDQTEARALIEQGRSEARGR
jgi:hypothetical protein